MFTCKCDFELQSCVLLELPIMETFIIYIPDALKLSRCTNVGWNGSIYNATIIITFILWSMLCDDDALY